MNFSKVTNDILYAIRYNRKPISKSELVKKTKYSLATVTDHTERLLLNNLIVEGNEGPSTGGRKPRLLSFNNEVGYVIAINLESNRVQVGITDLSCKIIASKESNNINVSLGPKKVLDEIKKIVYLIIDQEKISKDSILGVGIGLPGPVEYSKGWPLSLSIMPGWKEYPVREYWEEHFDCKCHVDNNVYTMALGEYFTHYKFHKNMENQLFLKVGNGVGVGIICDGQIYRGASESAGQIGHTNIGHNELCYCGNRGCLETIASARGIIRKAEELARNNGSAYLKSVLDNKGKILLEDVLKSIEELDPEMVEFIRYCGIEIGKTLGNFVNFFNPARITLGGPVTDAGDVLLASIRQSIYQIALPSATRNLKINRSKLGDDSGIVGAASLTIDEIISGLLKVPKNQIVI